MNRLRLVHFIVALTCLVSFTSCDKDDDDEPSQQALLTNGVWEGSSVYYNGQNYTQFFRDSINFDINEFSYRFDDNGEYRETYGRTILGTWKFDSADQQVIILDEGESYQQQAIINELSSTELNLEVSLFGPPVELRFTKSQ